MTIKRGRWAARVPGLRWGGQQIPREPRMTFDLESYGFDPGRKDESAMVVAARLPSGRLLFTSIKPPTKERSKFFPGVAASNGAAMGRAGFAGDCGMTIKRGRWTATISPKRRENCPILGRPKTALDEPDVTSQ